VMGEPEVEFADDDWAIVTRDGKPAAHFEHTVAVTENGADILTVE
jgi:methionyl aminopeptidase